MARRRGAQAATARLREVGERARAGVEKGELALLAKRGADCDVLLPRLPGGVGMGGPIPTHGGREGVGAACISVGAAPPAVG